MPLDTEREHQIGLLIPKGPPLAQSMFKDATCLAFAQGYSAQAAVDLGRRLASRNSPGFEPIFDPAVLDLD